VPTRDPAALLTAVIGATGRHSGSQGTLGA
jgi:hypothetical protein